MKTLNQFRLRAGDVIRLEGQPCQVLRVTDCSAVVAVTKPPREFTTLFGVCVRIQPKPGLVRICPNSEVPILNRSKTMNTNDENSHRDNSPFGEVIYSYTRAQAVADGVQVEVTKIAQEAGIRFPVFLTRAVYDAYVTVPPDVEAQDEAGRLWDIINLLKFAIRKAQPGQTRLPFALYVRNDNRRPRLIKLIAACGALDIDDPQPAITVMMLDED